MQAKTTNLTLVDRATGFVTWMKIRNETTQAVVDALRTWFDVVGNPRRIRSDGGPCFKSRAFQEYCTEEDIIHDFSAPYSPASNGLAENAVGICRDLYTKCKETNAKFSTALGYSNRMVRKEGGLSPAELFFKREVRKGGLPKIHQLSLDLQKARDLRQGKAEADRRLTQTARKPDKFEVGDEVTIQDHITGKWMDKAKVTGIREDGKSYQLETERGTRTVRSHRHIKLSIAALVQRRENDDQSGNSTEQEDLMDRCSVVEAVLPSRLDKEETEDGGTWIEGNKHAKPDHERKGGPPNGTD